MFNLELMILCSCIKSLSAAQKCVSALKPNYFYSEDNEKIFVAICKVIQSGETPELLNLLPYAHKEGFKVDSLYAASSYYMAEIGFLDDLIYELMARDSQRRFYEEFGKMSEMKDPKDFMNKLKELYEKYYISKTVRQAVKSLSEVLNDYEDGKSFLETLIDRQERFFSQDKMKNGFMFSFPALDKYTKLISFGSYIIIGARTRVGKTSISLSLASRIVDQGIPVVFVSLEMKTQQIANKLVSSASGVDIHKFSDGSFSPLDSEKIEKAVTVLDNPNFYLVESSNLTLDSLESFIKTTIDQIGAKVFFFDYLTLIKTSGHFRSKHLEVDAISKSLQSLAKKYNVAIFALAQFSRKIEERTDKKTSLADLKESGSLEEDADLVLLLSRPHLQDYQLDKNIVQIHIAKNRLDGDEGVIKVYYENGKLKPILG